VFVTAFLVVMFAACAGDSGDQKSLRDALAAESNDLARVLVATPGTPTDGILRVRLAFGAAADLDIYVTDPNHETAYFANSPTKQGAQLAEDVLCDSPLPHIETVTLEDPIPGRYRVGVDYPRACAGDGGPVSYVVTFDAKGRRESRRGSIEPGEFLAIVLETEVD
jgi:hypothetical protein